MYNNQIIGDINNSSLYGSNINGERNGISTYYLNNCRSCKIFIIIALSIGVIFCGISVACLCNILPTTRNLGVDYIGIIIGVLTLLVTILVGWNIFSVVHIEKNMEELKIKHNNLLYSFQGIKDELERKINLIDNQSGIRTMEGLAQIYDSFAGFCATDVDHFPSCIAHSIQAAYCYAHAQDYKNAEKCIRIVLQIKEPSKIKLSDSETAKMVDLVKNIPHHEKINDIEKLYILLNKLGNDYK